MTEQSKWREDIFDIRVRWSDGQTLVRKVNGHVNGLWALDERRHVPDVGRPKKVWCLNHLPTGYAALYIFGSLKAAQKIAGEVSASADWNFTNPEEARKRGASVKAVRDQHPGAFASSDEVSQADYLAEPVT